MPKPIPELMRLEIRSYYLNISKRVAPLKGWTRRGNACKVLQDQFPRYFKGMSIEDVYVILSLPSEEECNYIKRGLVCLRCGHGDNLVVESRGCDEDGSPMIGFDIFCTTPDDNPNTAFSKCWYHLGRDEKMGRGEK